MSLEVTCEPPRINNGNIMTPKKVYRENEQLQFTCNPGYTFGERSDADCTEYGWNPKPFCKGQLLLILYCVFCYFYLAR